MLTFPQIIKLGGKYRDQNARFVRLVRLKTGYTPEGFAFAACQSYSTHHINPKGLRVVNPDRRRYVTVVKFLDAKLHCQVSCSCPDFMYTAEYVLNKRGAAQIEYSNGEAPDIKNPAQVVMVCKHLIRLYQEIQTKLQRKRQS